MTMIGEMMNDPWLQGFAVGAGAVIVFILAEWLTAGWRRRRELERGDRITLRTPEGVKVMRTVTDIDRENRIVTLDDSSQPPNKWEL